MRSLLYTLIAFVMVIAVLGPVSPSQGADLQTVTFYVA